MGAAKKAQHSYLICLFLILISVAVFWGVDGFHFTHYDDNVYVTGNPNVQAGLTTDSVKWAFTGKYDCNWMPLTWVSFMADCEIDKLISDTEIGPGQENPRIYHLTNLVLHMANTLLLFVVLSRLTGLRWRSAFVAALFAIHPAHVESVAWVAERKDVLSTLFWLLTLWAYIKYVARPGVGKYLLVVLTFALGLMSKSMLVTLPVALLLMDYWPLKRAEAGWKKLVLEKVPLFALAAVLGMVTVLAQQRGGSVAPLEMFPPGVRIANAAVSYVKYIGKLLWPRNLAVFYPHPVNSLPMWQVIGSVLLLATITFAAAKTARRRPYIIVGWLWYVLTLAPVIGLVQVGIQAMADRYTYVPFIGLFIIAAWGVPELVGKIFNRPDASVDRSSALGLAVVAAAGIAALGIRAHDQVRYWHDDFSLFGHTIEVTTNNTIAHYNLGMSLLVEGKRDEAIEHFKEAIRIDPKKVEAYNDLAGAYYYQGKLDDAIREWSTAVRILPTFVDVHCNLGMALLQKGRVDEAVEHYEKALKLKPGDSAIIDNLERARLRQ